MSIRSSGPWCGVCNNPILSGRINPFKVSISPTRMDSCDDCRDKNYVRSSIGPEELPRGPLRDLIDRAVNEGVLILQPKGAD